eukprot:TRINITY_DN9218_c0_g1_i4.p1 TRINITY_DN9218_c0_g1~~TRINITY_DN9218_c0_g1_i4.p1  ORF type:complete len:348 (+),score=31.94 TRINITY_DN9218_c0_g1_i4:143-1186(+)
MNKENTMLESRTLFSHPIVEQSLSEIDWGKSTIQGRTPSDFISPELSFQRNLYPALIQAAAEKPRKIFECISPRPADFSSNSSGSDIRKSSLNLDSNLMYRERSSPTIGVPKRNSLKDLHQSVCNYSLYDKPVTKEQLNNLLNYWKQKSQKFAMEKQALETRIRAKSLTRLRNSELTEDKSSAESLSPTHCCEKYKAESDGRTEDKETEPIESTPKDEVQSSNAGDNLHKSKANNTPVQNELRESGVKREIRQSILEKSINDYSSDKAEVERTAVKVNVCTKKSIRRSSHIKVEAKGKLRLRDYAIITLVILPISIDCDCLVFPNGNSKSGKLDSIQSLTLPIIHLT